MARTATAKQPEPAAESPAERQIPNIRPEFCKVQSAGQCWREILVRLPEGLIFDDLKEFKIWASIQGHRDTSLRKLDHLLIMSFDESWGAEVIVAQASEVSVTLTKPRLIRFPERDRPLLNDGTYQVQWFGTGYAVVRIKDQARMSPIVQTEAEANRDLGRQYPRVA